MILSAYLFAAAASAALAAAPAQASPAAPTQASKPAKEKKVCRSDTATGSIMTKRVCRTRSEWEALTAQSQSEVDRSTDADRSQSMVGASRD